MFVNASFLKSVVSVQRVKVNSLRVQEECDLESYEQLRGKV